jgi:hypothetical protein
MPVAEPKTVASLISLVLNGETKDDLQAQVLIENLTTHIWEENVELLNLVETDMDFLALQFQELDKITIYNYTSTPIPGQIQLFLENVHFREKEYLEEFNYIVESDREKWWYIEEFTFTSILEEAGIVDSVDFNYCGSFANIIATFYDFSQRYAENITLQSNETIIASWWIEDNGSWVFNEDFLNVIEEEIFSLSEVISGIANVSSYLYKNETDINNRYPDLYNLTEPIPNEYSRYFGEIGFSIDLSKDSSRAERNAALKVLVKLIMSKWYIQGYMEVGPCDFGPDMIRYLFGLFLAVPVGSIVLIIVSIRLVRNIKKKGITKESELL